MKFPRPDLRTRALSSYRELTRPFSSGVPPSPRSYPSLLRFFRRDPSKDGKVLRYPETSIPKVSRSFEGTFTFKWGGPTLSPVQVKYFPLQVPFPNRLHPNLSPLRYTSGDPRTTRRFPLDTSTPISSVVLGRNFTRYPSQCSYREQFEKLTHWYVSPEWGW